MRVSVFVCVRVCAQLRNLVWSTSRNDVFVVSQNSVNHWHPMTRAVTEVRCKCDTHTHTGICAPALFERKRGYELSQRYVVIRAQTYTHTDAVALEAGASVYLTLCVYVCMCVSSQVINLSGGGNKCTRMSDLGKVQVRPTHTHAHTHARTHTQIHTHQTEAIGAWGIV